MWQYFWSHAAYHLTRWFPRNNRIKIRILILIFTLAVLFPQFFVLTRDHSVRYCGQHLFDMLIASIIFTFFMIGFTFLFTLMDPVPREVKLAFHVFGLITFVFGVILTVFTAQADECRVNTEELYYLSLAIAVFSCISAAFFIVMIPFWIINTVKQNSVLDFYNRTGVCYEPVNCCQCLWHI